MTYNQLRGRSAELRPSALAYGVGWQQLIKFAAAAPGGGFTRTIPGDTWERLISLAFTLGTSAAAGIRALSIAYLDGDGFIFNLVPVSNEIGPSQTLVGYADLASVTPVQAPESHEIEGTAAAPAAGTTIVALALPSGGWTLNWQVAVEGTVAAPELNNFGLYQGAALQLQSENGNVVGQSYPQLPVQVQIPFGGATIAVKNIGVATAASVYVAQLVASPANVMQLQVQIPDFLLKSGWQVALQLAGAQAGDQLSNMGFLLERYPSSDVALWSPYVRDVPGSPHTPPA